MKISDILFYIKDSKIINETKNDNNINKIEIDSRKLNKGDLFICLRGDNNNGHDFIKDVINKELTGIIIDQEITKIETNIPIIKVHNTYDCLLKIASIFRNKYNIPLIAITGSVGKTTTKELIYNILSTKYSILKSEKNYNNHIGVPLTLFNLNDKHQMVVLELGMNHLGEISKLSKVCKPNTSIITKIGTSHIGNLGSKDNIFKAKMEILDGMDNGNLILNASDSYLEEVSNIKNINIYKCGFNKENDLYAYNIKTYKDKTIFNIKFCNKKYTINFNIPGKHLVTNVLLAIKCGLLYGIDIDTIIKQIGLFKAKDNRMNVININNNIVIDDCYNASLESTLGVLDVIKKYKQNKLIILGDILEIGDFAHTAYKLIDKKLKEIKNKKVLLVGNGIKYLKNYEYFNTPDEANIYLNSIDINNMVILLKASRGMHFEKIIEFIKNIEKI